VPRHRTIRATLDWSYALLSSAEQTVLHRLTVFTGGFSLAAAGAVVSDADLGEEKVIELVLELATKSLLAVEGRSPEPRFRLLATTRAFAIEKTKGHGELDTLAQRHAAYFLKLFDAVSHVV
jgi:predicted ATPase